MGEVAPEPTCPAGFGTYGSLTSYGSFVALVVLERSGALSTLNLGTDV